MPTISGLCVSLALLLLPAAASAQDLPLAPDAPVRVGGAIRAPRQIKRVNPVYPVEAVRARVTGVVILEAVIGTDGRVVDAKVLRSIPLLDQAAVDAVRQWEYEVTLLNGKPVRVIMTVTANFTLQSGPRQAVPGMPLTIMRLPRDDGRTEVWEISAERLAALPEWNPLAAGEPPLSVGRAVTTAHEWIQARMPGEKVELISAVVGRVGQQSAWMYNVRFGLEGVTRPAPGAGAAGPRPARPQTVIVLFDGAVLEPRVE